MGETRAKFKNWEISECDANDPRAEKMVEDARLIITILTNEESVKRINELIVKPERFNHMVISIIDENYPYSSTTLADWFTRHPEDRYFQIINISMNRDGKNSLLLNLGFYWNRKDNTFVCFRWST